MSGVFDLFGDVLGGNTSSAKTNQNSGSTTAATTTGNTTQNQTQSTSGSSQTNTGTTQQQQSTGTSGQATSTSTLDTGTQAALAGAIQSAAGNTSYQGTQTAAATSQQGDLVKSLTDQNAAIPGQIADMTKALSAQATNTYDTQTLPGIISQGNGVGGLDNSFTQLLQAQGNQNLQTQIAGIGANTQLAGLQLQGQNNATIANADNSYVTNQRAVDSGNTSGDQALAFLTDALKGGTTTSNSAGVTTGDTSGTSTSSTDATTLQNLISALTGTSNSNTNSNTNQYGNTYGNNTGTALSGLDGLLGSL